jgi:hypothetical protein
MSIYIDITEFMKRPHRTGIQRVTGELCRYWPAAVTAYPVWVRSKWRFGTPSRWDVARHQSSTSNPKDAG